MTPLLADLETAQLKMSATAWCGPMASFATSSAPGERLA